MKFATRTRIRATPEVVWSILTDLPRHPEWNTTVTKVEGTAALGNKVTVHAKISPDRAFPVKVTAFDAPHKMVWTGGAPLKFIFKGERTFLITPTDGGEVEFSMEEVFTGLFAGMIGKSIPDLQPAFDELAACLKSRAERS
ncbi:MAG: SRPBCC domain-containing protein [Polyangiaceae bacterium]